MIKFKNLLRTSAATLVALLIVVPPSAAQQVKKQTTKQMSKRLAVDKKRVAEHLCLVPLIVSSRERERHVAAGQRLSVRKLEAISQPDVDRAMIGTRGPGFREARHISLRRMIELHQPAVQQKERR